MLGRVQSRRNKYGATGLQNKIPPRPKFDMRTARTIAWTVFHQSEISCLKYGERPHPHESLYISRRSREEGLRCYFLEYIYCDPLDDAS
jgi:hypothetical protein